MLNADAGTVLNVDNSTKQTDSYFVLKPDGMKSNADISMDFIIIERPGKSRMELYTAVLAVLIMFFGVQRLLCQRQSIRQFPLWEMQVKVFLPFPGMSIFWCMY